MSEYRYYEFVAVDRPLDERELGEVRALSTRADVTATSFVHTDEWGDFRGDPRMLMECYYDAFLHRADRGTRRLAFRAPSRLLDLATAQRYCAGDSATARVAGEHLVIDLTCDEDDPDADPGGAGRLASIIPARADLVAGDLRLLYLAWLLCVQNREVPDEDVEPPVPPRLGALTASLRAVAAFLRIDPDLLAVAGRARPAEAGAATMAEWVAGLPVAEKNDVVLALLQGSDPDLRAALLQRFRGAAPSQAGRRTAGELLAAAEQHWAERTRAADERRRRAAAEEDRRRAGARERRREALAEEGEQAWVRVDMLIETRKQAEYDRAVELLVDLAHVVEPGDFGRRIADLRSRHARKSSLIDRFDRAGLQ